MTIGPGGSADIRVPVSAMVIDPKKVDVSKSHLFGVLAGAIRYKSEFSGSPRHVTKICVIMIGFDEADAPQVAQAPCQFWNCSDKDCKTERKAYDRWDRERKPAP